MMQKEKERLDAGLPKKSGAVRQHFLRFAVPLTWRLQAQCGFVYDSTLGHSEYEGFRTGFCHPFRVYDYERDEVMNLWEIPLIAMDGTLADYRGLSPEESFDYIKQLILTTKRYGGVCVLLFHNTCYDDFDFPGWGKLFERCLSFAQSEGALLGSGREVLQAFLGERLDESESQD
jgi:hypothetical protein